MISLVEDVTFSLPLDVTIMIVSLATLLMCWGGALWAGFSEHDKTFIAFLAGIILSVSGIVVGFLSVLIQ